MNPDETMRALKDPEGFLLELAETEHEEVSRAGYPRIDKIKDFVSSKQFVERLKVAEQLKELCATVSEGAFYSGTSENLWFFTLSTKGYIKTLRERARYLCNLTENFDSFREETLKGYEKCQAKIKERNAILRETRPPVGAVVKVSSKKRTYYGVLESAVEATFDPEPIRNVNKPGMKFSIRKEYFKVRPILSDEAAYSSRVPIKADFSEVSEVTEQETIIAFLDIIESARK